MTHTSESNLTSWAALFPRLARYLPAAGFQRLRALPENLAQLTPEQQPLIVNELLTARRSLEPLQRVLQNYVPRYLLELNLTPGQPHGELLEGTFIFADVTGFTALTELLSRQAEGRGYEAMNQIMNRLFATVLEPMITSGGDLLFFIGDAVLLHFPKQPNQHDVLQAIRAALRMERAIQPFADFETQFGRCSLTMSAGIERGLVYAGVVGDPQRMELLVSGPGIYAATAAEQIAEPGQVALGEQARTIAAPHFTLNDSIVIDDLGASLGDYEISPPTSRRAGKSTIMAATIPDVLEAMEHTLRRVEHLAPFLPEDMLARLVNTERQRQLQPELRPVAVHFINIVGLEELALAQGPDLATQVFQRFFVRAQEIVTQHEGVISQVDAWSKGFILLNTFGTPRAHEGTRRYAVSAALHLARALDWVNREFNLTPPLQHRSGITQGLVFTGEIGASYRRESVIAGPAVNRAARLMSKAQPGQIILDSDIWANASSAFVGDPLPPVTLKGIEGPVVIVNVREVRRGTRLLPPERPILNREAELAALQQGLAALLPEVASARTPGAGSAWLITGETGLGKTTLVAALAELARQQGLTVMFGRCQPHSRHIPLFPWIDMLTGWLDLNEQSSPALQRVRLTEELASLGMAAMDRVLANLLALPALDHLPNTMSSGPAAPAPENRVSMLNALQAKLQQPVGAATRPNLNALLADRLAAPASSRKTLWRHLAERVSGAGAIIELLKNLTARQPVVVILEDIHWFDQDSTALLAELLPQLLHLPLMLVMTGRETSLNHPHLTTLPLPKLPEAILAQIAQRTLGAESLDSSLAGWLTQRANGNPMVVEELAQALQHSEAVWLDRNTGAVHWTGQTPPLPLSLHTLLLARLDELSVTPQDILKRAAVLGLSFELDSLVRLCQPQLSAEEVETALEEAVQADFIGVVGLRTYQFNHPLLPETIYASLTFSQRQRWHTQFADWLVERHESEQEQLLELIAYHHLRGVAIDKAASFGCRAGDRARERGAYAGAYDFYTQVLALPNLPSEIQRQAAESQADVLVLQGRYEAAQEAYRLAVRLGSLEASGKQAILAGQIELLSQTEFSAALRPWAEGSWAWLLAQAGQIEAALQRLEPTLAAAGGSVQIILEALFHTLTTERRVGPYDEWLKQFAQATLVDASEHVQVSHPETSSIF